MKTPLKLNVSREFSYFDSCCHSVPPFCHSEAKPKNPIRRRITLLFLPYPKGILHFVQDDRGRSQGIRGTTRRSFPTHFDETYHSTIITPLLACVKMIKNVLLHLHNNRLLCSHSIFQKICNKFKNLRCFLKSKFLIFILHHIFYIFPQV